MISLRRQRRGGKTARWNVKRARSVSTLAVVTAVLLSLLQGTAVLGVAVTPQAAPHELFESKNAGKTVPEFTIDVDGQVFQNQNTNYIVSRDGALWNGDERLRFVGYDSPNYAFLEDPNWHAIQNFEMEDLIKSVAQSNAKVVRVYSMGFQILPSYTGNALYTENGASIEQAPKHIGWNPTAPKVATVNPAPASYTQGDYYMYEPVWEKVDYFLAMADRYGVRVIFPFVNEWDWFGGRGAFANYYGISSAGTNFYGTNANSLFMGEMYDRLVGMIMNRTNTVTGIQYKNDPAIMAWESSNEFTGAASEWTINRGINLHDTLGISQLFLDGTYTQGAQGATQMNAYRVRVASPYIDIMNDHFYANSVPNFVAGMVPLAQIAKEAGKPYIVGEYGLTSANEIDHLLRAVIDYDVDGAMVWSLRYRDARGGYYWHRDDQSTYNINFNSYHWPGFAENFTFEEKSVVDTIYNYAYAINGQAAPLPPVPDTAPLLFDIASPTMINWRGTTGANSYDVERATSPGGPWTVVGKDLTDSMSVVREGPLFRDATTNAGTGYYYRVRGRNVNNPSGYSPYSNVVGPVDGDVRSFGANIVAGLDPSFESGPSIAAWAPSSTTPGLSYRSGGTSPNQGVAVYTTEDKHSGDQSIKLTGIGELWAKFNVQPRNSYVASFWMKTTSNATKYTVLSRENKAGVDNGFGDIDPYQYRGPGPSNANNILAFSDYRSRTILTSVDKEFGNSISDVTTINDGQWHYYTAVFNGGDLDIKKGTTEANLIFSNRVAGTTIYVDDVNIHESLLANNTFTGWGVRWNAQQPWVFKSKTTSNNASTTALLEQVTGSGGSLSQDALVKPHTDYSLAYFTQSTSNGVKFAVLDENGGYIVPPTTAPQSTTFVPNYVTFNSGDSQRVTVAFYDAVKSTGTFRVDDLDLIPTANAEFAHAVGGGVVTEPPLSAGLNPAAIENGESTLGAQNLFDALWDTENILLTLDNVHAATGMYGVRVDYSAGARAVKSFATSLDLSAYEGLTLWLESVAGSNGTVQLVLKDGAGGTATYQFPLSSATGQHFVRFPATGFNSSSVVQAELSVLGRSSGTFYFDDIVAASPYVVESGDGASAWVRAMGRPGENVVTGRTASSAISTASAPDNGIENSSSRSVTFNYNDGTNRNIKVWSEIGKTLGAVDWSDRDALQLWIKRGTTTPGSDTKMAIRLDLANGQYAEAPYRLNDVAAGGEIVTIRFSSFTVYPTLKPFDPAASGVTGAGLVFSQNGPLVATVPTTGNTTIGTPVLNNVVYLDDVRAVTHVTNDAPAGGATVQYSDALSPDVTISASDVDSQGSDLTANAVGLPTGLSLAIASTSGAGVLPGIRTWTVAGNVTDVPGSYPVTVTVTDDRGLVGTTSFTIVVTQEDADVTYTGDTRVFTSTPAATTASVLLRATVRDSSLIAAFADAAPGDVRTATVTFMEGATTLCGPLPVGLIGTALTTGSASCMAVLGVGSHTIDVIVNSNYVGTTQATIPITVLPGPKDRDIKGDGDFVIGSSAGSYAADNGSRAKFKIDAKYDKAGPKGNIELNYDAGAKSYRIKLTSLDVTGLDREVGGTKCDKPASATCAELGYLRGTASLLDVTGKGPGVVVGTGFTLQVTFTDRGKGKTDSVGFTLWDGNTLLFSSDWNGAMTLERVLHGGNIGAP